MLRLHETPQAWGRVASAGSRCIGGLGAGACRTKLDGIVMLDGIMPRGRRNCSSNRKLRRTSLLELRLSVLRTSRAKRRSCITAVYFMILTVLALPMSYTYRSGIAFAFIPSDLRSLVSPDPADPRCRPAGEATVARDG